MKSNILLLALAGGTALVFAADSPKKQPDEMQKLQARIAYLEKRVNALETRFTFQSLQPGMTPASPGLRLHYLEEPPNTGSIDVNGLEVFRVPLGAKPNP
jgi:hypothetical protein